MAIRTPEQLQPRLKERMDLKSLARCLLLPAADNSTSIDLLYVPSDVIYTRASTRILSFQNKNDVSILQTCTLTLACSPLASLRGSDDVKWEIDEMLQEQAASEGEPTVRACRDVTLQ